MTVTIQGLSFGWECNDSEWSIIPNVKEDSADTDILIVVGYSFLYFNRETDREIILSMKQLRKVYFQAPGCT